MLCRVEMPANEQIYGRFYRYRLFRGAGSGRMAMLLLPLLAVVAVVLMLTSGMPIYLSGGVILLLVLYLGYTLYYKPMQIFRKKGGAAMLTEVTMLTDSGLNRTVKSEEGGAPETASVQYSALHHAVETGKDFYLFTSPAQAYMLDKEYFTKGSPEDLRAVLNAKLGAKFMHPGKKKPAKNSAAGK